MAQKHCQTRPALSSLPDGVVRRCQTMMPECVDRPQRNPASGTVVEANPILECGMGHYTYGSGGLEATSPPSHDEGGRWEWLRVWPTGC